MTGAPTPSPGAGPSSGHSAGYSPATVASTPDGRLFSRVVPRNGPPLLVALAPWLAGRVGTVLEIGCGTGQHAASFALGFPALDWWPSDPDPVHRQSAAAWAAEMRAPPRPPLSLDAADDWARDDAVVALGPLTAVISMNVIHIAPFAVATGIVAGAARTLAPGGLLIFYGPFNEGGRHTGPGNAAFDAGLRADNPDWGLRDVDSIRALGAQAGLDLAALISMPADNRLLILRK